MPGAIPGIAIPGIAIPGIAAWDSCMAGCSGDDARLVAAAAADRARLAFRMACDLGRTGVFAAGFFAAGVAGIAMPGMCMPCICAAAGSATNTVPAVIIAVSAQAARIMLRPPSRRRDGR